MRKADSVVTIGGDYDGLDGAIKGSKSKLKKFGSDLRAREKDLVKYSAAASAAGAVGLATLFNKQADVIDHLAKTSDALGVTTRKMQALNHIAELNGVSSEGMAKGMQRMEKLLGVAARKGGASAEALEDLGVNLDTLANKSPDEQMQILANALGGLADQNIKASIATDLFGREGVKMLKVLTQLDKEGVEPTAKALDDLGVTISRVDAAKVEAANDAIFKSKQVISGVANTVTIELAPYVEAVANQFLEASKASGGFGDETRDAVATAIRGVAKLADVVHGVNFAFEGGKLVAYGFSGAIISVVELAGTAVASFADSFINNINFIIQGLNKIPGVAEIAFVDSVSDSDFMKGLHRMGDESRQKVADLRSNLQKLAMQELPSEKVEAFLKSIEKAATQAGIELEKSLTHLNPNTGEEIGGLDLGDSKALDKLKAKYLVEQELEREHRAAMALIGEEFNAANFESEEQWRTLKERAEEDHSKKLQSVKQKTMTALEKFNAMSWQGQTKQVSSSLVEMTAGVAQHSRKMFEINKAAAIAEAIVNNAQAITKTYTQYPYPLNIPMAAAQAAAGLAQLNAIKSQSFGGGGSGRAPSSSATEATAVTSVDNNANGGGGAGEPQRLLVEGITPDQIFSGRTLISLINEAQENGAILTL